MSFLTSELAARLNAGAASQRVDAARIADAIVRMLMTWMDRSRSRRSLAELDERMLKDLGLTRWDVTREVEKPFWRA